MTDTTENEYFDKNSKKIVSAVWFNAHNLSSEVPVLDFAKKWGQLGLSIQRYTSGDSNSYGAYEGYKLVTPTNQFTESVYVIWNSSTLEFDYLQGSTFESNYIKVTDANRKDVNVLLHNS